MSFVTVDAHEIRHEILIKVSALTPGKDGFQIPVDMQEAFKEGALDTVLAGATLMIGESSRPPDHRRADFVDVLPTGVSTRAVAAPEPVASSVLG